MSEIHMMAALLNRIDPELSEKLADGSRASESASKVIPITQNSKEKVDKSA